MCTVGHHVFTVRYWAFIPVGILVQWSENCGGICTHAAPVMMKKWEKMLAVGETFSI